MQNKTSDDINKFVIQGINEPTIYKYFQSLNSGDFAAAAHLFTEDGILKPPFEKQIQGRDSIAHYLETEAKGMRFCPESGGVVKLENDQTQYAQYQVQGKVQTNWFTVNVGWLVQLASAEEISMTEVKLLAELQDLLNLKRK